MKEHNTEPMIDSEKKNRRYAIIDVETTGGDPKHGHITDIAIFLVEGGTVVDEFCTLVNPECHIPKYISELTGISDDMVADAPRFYEIAKRVVEITTDAIFVAHNVGYDYGFVQQEFKRLGYRYRRITFDTVKMSRKLLPGHASYSLGNLTEDLSIPIVNRHRAEGDARATVELFKLLLDKASLNDLQSDAQIEKIFGKNIARLLFEELPEETGVYYFHDADGNIIYIGKSKNIAKRTLTHFSNFANKKTMEMCAKVHSISYDITRSELVALIKEDIEIKRHQPIFNRAQRRKRQNFGIYASYNEQGYIALTAAGRSVNGTLINTYHSMDRAKNVLIKVIEKYRLCQKICGQYKSDGACFHYQIGLCSGACIGEEAPDSYNERARQAIADIKDASKNYYVIDEIKDANEVWFVKVENGEMVGLGNASRDFLSGSVHELDGLIDSVGDTGNSAKLIQSYLAKNPRTKTIAF